MDWLFTVIYLAYIVIQVHLVRKLYGSIKVKMPPVAKEGSCLLFMIKMIIFLHIGLRIIMNVLSDTEART